MHSREKRKKRGWCGGIWSLFGVACNSGFLRRVSYRRLSYELLLVHGHSKVLL